MPDSKPVALITGASGLLGREILFAFESRGWSVVGTGLNRSSRSVSDSDPSTQEGDSARQKIVKLDLQNEEDIIAVLDKVKPAVVIHSAATRSPDAVASDPKVGLAINATSTENLVRHATDRGAFVIFISTDYVFPGTLPIPTEAYNRQLQNSLQPGSLDQTKSEKRDDGPTAGYGISDQTRPVNGYGLTKLYAERGLDQALSETSAGAGASLSSKIPCARKTTSTGAPAAVALRVPLLYGHTSDPEDPSRDGMHTLVDQITQKAHEGAAAARATRQAREDGTEVTATDPGTAPVSFLADDTAVRYPTWTGDVARATVDISERYSGVTASEKGPAGTAVADALPKTADWPTRLHFSAQQPLTRYEMATVFARILGLGDAVVPASSLPAATPPPFSIVADYSVAPEVELALSRLTAVKVPEEEEVMRSKLRPVHNRLDTAGLAELGISTTAVKFEDWWRQELKAYRRK